MAVSSSLPAVVAVVVSSEKKMPPATMAVAAPATTKDRTGMTASSLSVLSTDHEALASSLVLANLPIRIPPRSTPPRHRRRRRYSDGPAAGRRAPRR